MPVQTRWGAVFVLILAGVISALQIGKVAIAVPVLQRELALTLVTASWVVGTYGVLGAIGGLPAGILTSLLSARTTVIAGLVDRGRRQPRRRVRRNRRGADCNTRAGRLRIARRGAGGAATACAPSPRRRTSQPVLAVFAAHLPLGSVIMMLAAPHAMSFGWQGLWLINGAVVLGYALVVARLPLDEAPPAHAVQQSVLTNIGAVLGTPGPVLLALAFGTYTFQYLALSGLLPALLVDRMGLSIAAAGTVSAIAVAANAVGNMSAGALLRLGVPVWSIMVGAFAFVGVAAVGIFSDTAPVALVAALAAASLGFTGLIPGSIYAAAPRLAPTSAMLAIALGLINQVTNIGNLAGPAAMAFTVRVARLGRRAAAVRRRRGDRRDDRAAASAACCERRVTPAECRLP